MAVTKGNRKKVRDVGDLIFYVGIIALPILQLLIFYIYVNFNSVLMSFQQYDTLKDEFTWNLTTNFVRLWEEVKSSILLDAFKNSLIIWVYTSIFGRFLSILFSYYIYKKWAFGYLFKFFLFLPTIFPAILLVLIFKININFLIKLQNGPFILHK